MEEGHKHNLKEILNCEECLIEVAKKAAKDQDDYYKHDHIHCFRQKSPPCGQKIKHMVCCLCEEPNPEIEVFTR